MKLRTSCASFLTIVSITSGPALAQAIDCGQVLNNNLINTRSVSVSESIIANMKADICSSEFESSEQAQTYMRSGGWSLNVFGYFDNALTDNKSRGSSDYDVRRSDFCNKSASELSRSLGTEYEEANGQFALEAFERCVELRSADTIYVDYELIGSGQGQLVAGNINRFKAQDAGSLRYFLQGFSTTPQNAGVQCKFLSRPIPADVSVENPVSVDATPAGFSCEKTEDKSVIIDIQTSEGSFRVVAPSSEAEEETAIDVLRAEVSGLSSDIDELRDQNVELQTQIDQNRVLAVVTVVETRVNAAQSSSGVRFNSNSGIITFPNPDGSNYAVVISDLSEANKANYLTETNYVHSRLSSTEVKVHRTTLDTGPRNAVANNFTAVIVRAGN